MQEYILKTERLLLKPLAAGEENNLWPYVSNPEISKDMSWTAHQTIEETKEFVDDTIKRMQSGRTICWGVYKDDLFCGVFSLIAILRRHRSLVYDRAELAYWVGPEFQRQGLMYEAGKAVLDFAFNNLMLHKLVVGHHSNNEASKRLILKLNFNFLYEESEVFQKDGVWVDCKFYELKKSDYLNR